MDNETVIMSKIEERQQEIIEEFKDLDDWMDRYAYIIELGNSMEPIEEKSKTPENLIQGCQSRAWLTAEIDDDGKVIYQADSDAIIVKGIIYLLIKVLSGNSPEEILDSDLHFINDIGLADHLSPTRSNGLLAVLKQMKMYALAYNELKNKDKNKP